MKKITFVILMLIPLSVFALDNSDVYQTARRILADNVPVKAIAAINDENVEYLYWYALFSIDKYDVNVQITKEIMQFRAEDGVEYVGIGKNGFPNFINDYWCRALSFSPTKASYYEKYLKVMKHRRQLWRIF